MRLAIRKYGDPILRKQGKRIVVFDETVIALVASMVETMHGANGVGLAAQQVGEPLQIAVVDVSEVEDRPSTMKINGESRGLNTVMPLVLINPVIVSAESKELDVEGCLSIPGVSDEVLRSGCVQVIAQDLDAREFHIEATGLLARALQHEIDHLQGVLFTDRLSAVKKLRWKKELVRMEKTTRAELAQARPADSAPDSGRQSITGKSRL